MKLSENARITYERRYLIKDEKGKPVETPEDLLRRVAANIAAVEKDYGKDAAEIECLTEDFFRIMSEAQFIPNSPTLMNAGRELQQLSACFVLPLEDSMEGIFTALKNMALVQKTGGGTGFAFDRLRPSNDLVRSTNGVASGPISFLKIFDAATEAVKQGGTRRGANMGSLIYNHPNILDFIRSKEKEDEINNFNISVAVSDEFMRKATGDDPDPLYDLVNPRTGEVYRDPESGEVARLDAAAVFDLIVQHAWGKGDPGIIFIDQMNRFNPTPNIGRYETTNPCVTGDTFVHTAEGPRTVSELIGKQTTLIVNGKPYRTTAGGFFKTGEKSVLKIKTREGFMLRATSDHPLLQVDAHTTIDEKPRHQVDDRATNKPRSCVTKKTSPHVIRVNLKIGQEEGQRWVKAGDLKPGDKIKLHNHRHLPGWEGLYTETEGYSLGLLTGRNLSSTGRREKSPALLHARLEQKKAVGMACPAFAPLHLAPLHLVPLHLVPLHLAPLHPNGEREAGAVIAETVNLPEQSALKQMALSLGLSLENITITPYLETKTSSRFYRGFLRGIFDTCATIRMMEEENAPEIFLQFFSDPGQGRLHAIQRMLARCGIISAVGDLPEQDLQGTQNLRGKPREQCLQGRKNPQGPQGRQDMHNSATFAKNDANDENRSNCRGLFIRGDNVHVFAEEIGFGNARKQKHGEQLVSSSDCTLENNLFTATVEAVDRDKTETVYDVEVPGINAFDANGLMAHNCGEQPLLPNEACCLGSINLGQFVTKEARIDWDSLDKLIHTAVRFLDNVIDAGNYVIPEIASMHKEGNRKIGLGIMGWHDMLVKLGITYDSEKAIETAEQVMSFIDSKAKKASVSLAEERSVFPHFEGSIYDTGKPEDRVRNATRTTIAPTGTISILASASSGIEPYFSIAFIRKNILGGLDLPEVNPLFMEIAREENFFSEDLIREIARGGRIPETSAVPEKYKALFKTAMEIDYSWHVRHQAAFQKYTNNAVSKTINLKQDATVEDVKNAYIAAWEAGCKGITIYRDASRTKQVLNVGDGTEEVIIKPTRRPKTLSGQTTSIRTALGNLFVTVNSADGKPFELFAQIGKAGSDVVAFTEAIARLISLALRCGVSVDDIVTQLEGIGGARSVGFGPNRIMSVPDAIGQALRNLAQSEQGLGEGLNGTNLEICPECGTCALIRAEGCLKCEACGFSEC